MDRGVSANLALYTNSPFAESETLYICPCMRIAIINGPNLNLLGRREPEIYGSQTFEEYFELLKARFPTVDLIYFQSNHEGAIIDFIQEEGYKSDGLVVNAAALSHTSQAIADAITAVSARAVEVHISNVNKRESFRHHSFLSAVCDGCIVGLGLYGYEAAVQYFLSKK